MATPSLLLLLFLFLFLSSSSSSSGAAATSLALADKAASTFIQTSCNATSYPSLCYAALAPYAGAVRSSPLRLALVATRLSIPSLESAADESASLYSAASAKGPSSSGAARALKDCGDVLRDAVGNTRYSLSQLRGMRRAAEGPAQGLWALSNAQTYMSAALTKEDTCLDGLKETGASAESVRAGVLEAEKYTSNALGLVNFLRTLY